MSNKSIEDLLREYEPDSSTTKAANGELKYINSPTTAEESKRLLGEVLTDLMNKGYNVNSHLEEVDITRLTPVQGVDTGAVDFYEKVYTELKSQGKQIPPIIVFRYTDVDVIADGHHRCASLLYRMNETMILAYVIEMPSEVDPEEIGAPTFADLTEEDLHYEQSSIEF